MEKGEGRGGARRVDGKVPVKVHCVWGTRLGTRRNLTILTRVSCKQRETEQRDVTDSWREKRKERKGEKR